MMRTPALATAARTFGSVSDISIRASSNRENKAGEDVDAGCNGQIDSLLLRTFISVFVSMSFQSIEASVLGGQNA
jgi:hypothetical protein